MPNEVKRNSFKLEVPIESPTEGEPVAGQKVKVVARNEKGRLFPAVVTFDARGRATATFEFPDNPGALEVAVAPAEIDDDVVHSLQTVSTRIDGRRLEAGKLLRVAPTIISALLWSRWRSWCRTFVVRGKVVCADGSPVPGAKVCAFDIDSFWWFSSRQQVGCKVTNLEGEFEIKFRWCCGFKPKYWWARRRWQLDQVLADHLIPVLDALPRPIRVVPSSKPSSAIFSQLLGDRAVPAEIDPSTLDGLRDRLLRERRLPHVPELERLNLWPWAPWNPWFDCNPDLVFTVTQECQGRPVTIVGARGATVYRNVPTTFEVTLVANGESCCYQPQDPDPEGICGLLQSACSYGPNEIGGNPGAAAGPVGYASPGTADQPFAENIALSGRLGSDIDYYQIEVSENDGASWEVLDGTSAGGFARTYWVPATNEFENVSFTPQPVGGKLVFESRRHYEQTHDPATWDTSRIWQPSNYWTLGIWQSGAGFDDGLYVVRLKGFKLEADGTLSDVTANGGLRECLHDQDETRLTLRLDNRFVGGLSGHPTAPDHPCGAGTVHTCTLEPDTDILAVRFNGNPILPCEVIDGKGGGPLEIDFLAHDPDGHLGSYSLTAQGGENMTANLLDVAGVSLTSLMVPPGSPVPVENSVGPTYALAVSQGAMRPIWKGGKMRLRIADVSSISIGPSGKSCITQLELIATKRSIVSCVSAHQNRTQYGFLMLL